MSQIEMCTKCANNERARKHTRVQGGVHTIVDYAAFVRSNLQSSSSPCTEEACLVEGDIRHWHPGDAFRWCEASIPWPEPEARISWHVLALLEVSCVPPIGDGCPVHVECFYAHVVIVASGWMRLPWKLHINSMLIIAFNLDTIASKMVIARLGD